MREITTLRNIEGTIIGVSQLKLMSIFIILNITILGLNDSTAQSNRKDSFVLGINGHPLNSNGEYATTSLQKQMNMLRELRIKHYRFDILFTSNGDVKKPERLDSIIQIINKNGIIGLPVLSTAGLIIPKDTIECYKKGFEMGHKFSLKYGLYFKTFELGNEMEIPLLVHRNLKGFDVKDYDGAQFRRVASLLKGMNNGIKESSNTALTIINFGETHYGYLKLLKKVNVDFDIIGHHWYFNRLYTDSGHKQVLDSASKIFAYQKPIFITEFNYALGSSQVEPDVQAKATSEFLKNISKNPLVNACYFYELMDETSLNFSNSKSSEKHFGLFTERKTKIIKKKSLIKELIFQ